MSVTSKDIARELNLSQPTVSRILNGDEKHRAAEETRQRVWEAAQRLGYQPNAVARSLRRGRTDIIGVHTGNNYDVRNDFLGAIVGALQCACAEFSLDVMLHQSGRGSSAEQLYGKLRDGRVDGLILHTGAEDPLVALLRESSLPVVAVADPLPGLVAVTSDDCKGMASLLDELWRRGYRRFIFLKPKLLLPSVERRRAAFEEQLAQRGLSIEARRVLEVDFEKTEPLLPKLLEVRRVGGPLAICCWNDLAAYDLLRACVAQNVCVPNDLAIAGFDGFRDEKMPARQLLTVRCPWESVAGTALRVLVKMIESRGESDQYQRAMRETKEIRLPATVLDGDTA